MPDITPELLREAFIDPIRFALVLDDDFPTYAQMARKDERKFDFERAGNLFEFCRGQGWLCDVDNAAHVAEEFERAKHLNQSDLLVLDFHLDPGNPEDPTKALGVLQSLARSNHFNLVIIYTAANPADVARDVAYSLGAGCAVIAEELKEVKDFFEELDPDDYDAVKSECNVEIVQSFLGADNRAASARQLIKLLHEKGIKKSLTRSAIGVLCQEYLESNLSAEVVRLRQSMANVEVCFSDTSPMWIAEGNLFAVVVNKENPVSVILDRLHAALISWDPSPLKLLMIHARAALEKVGTTVDTRVLETPRRQAGWLLRIIASNTLAERRSHIKDLYGRLFEKLIVAVDEAVVGFGVRLFNGLDGKPVEAASRMAKASGLSHLDIYHALNEYLCSDVHLEGSMTTGVVFRCSKDEGYSYWLCASPACDLVEGQNNIGWDEELHPYRPISAIRLTPVNGLQKRLEGATQGRDIFLYIDGAPVVLEVADGTTRKMKLETMLLSDGGAILDSKFAGLIIGPDDKGQPNMIVTEFESLALLRPDYANKFLAESGYQRARIGVDFVCFPKP
ncbi:response regulator receiver domain [Pseudomonas alliivorans]|nr:response regulator receiver domain [Pseudomonas alliivorans]